jgi:hypothetical protein
MDLLEELGIGELVQEAVGLGTNARVSLVFISETPGDFDTAPTRTETTLASVPAVLGSWVAETVEGDSTPRTGLEVFVATADLSGNVPKDRMCRVVYAGQDVLVENVKPVAAGGSDVAGYTLVCEGF